MTVYHWKQAGLILLTTLVGLYVLYIVPHVVTLVLRAEPPVTVVTYSFAEHSHAVKTGGTVSYIFKHQHSHDGVHGHTLEELGQ